MATCGNKRQPPAPSQIQSSAVGVATVATSFAKWQRRRRPSGKAVAGVAIVAAIANESPAIRAVSHVRNLRT